MNEQMEPSRAALAKEEARLANNKGAVQLASQNGPVAIQIIRALAAAVESQAAEIEELKKKVSTHLG